MPHVIIKVRPGYTEQEKASLTESIVTSMENNLKCCHDAISVAIDEVSPEAWAEDVYHPVIRPQMDNLYKKPGYSL